MLNFRIDSCRLHHYPTDTPIEFKSNDDFSIQIKWDTLETLVIFNKDNCFEKVYGQLVDWNLFEWGSDLDESYIRTLLENF